MVRLHSLPVTVIWFILNYSSSQTIPLLAARGISRRFANTVAVHEVDIHLACGDVVGFLGLNGAGKTTTLRMLCGTLAADSGEIFIDGFDVRREPQAARARLGFLPDTPPLYPELSVDEFLRYCARLRRLPKAHITDSVERVKQQTGLESRGRQRIAGLSRGYQQRLGIAQAIIHQPTVVVLDEPTNGLDPRQIEEIRTLIAALSGHAAVLLSTHLLAEVYAVCNRVLIIHKGVIAYQSTLDALSGPDALAQTFFRITGETAGVETAGVEATKPEASR